MRIQHNIMAMSAYRNYTNNVSAMKKNLEKLSSGYKINRAGDDAAGLAISEKMRAQITGLETAQKNAKDGISLVQTAEGALTEVHDMLNRMVELATMSANGTYDNTTDRAQLQKEMDQLNDEINRIADSANFNGIKLLDGSMDAKGNIRGTGSAAAPGSVTSIGIPDVGPTLHTNTILHTGAATGSTGTEFSVDLHDVKFDGKVGDELTITLGEGSKATAIKLTVKTAASKGYTAGDIVNALTGGSKAANFTIEVGGSTFTPGSTAELTIGGGKFTLADGGNGRISFTQKGIPATGSEEVLGGMKVSVTSTPKNPEATGTLAAALATTTAGASAAVGVYTLTFSGLTSLDAGKYDVTVSGQKVTVEITANQSTATAAHAALASAVAAALASKVKDGVASDSTYTVAASGAKLTFTASGNGVNGTNVPTNAVTIATNNDSKRTTAHKGDYNTQTTDVKNVAFGGSQRLASTTFTLDASKVKVGDSIIIGGTEYTFSADSADKGNANNKVYIGDMVDADGNLKTGYDLGEIARRISDSAANNTTWTVGVAGSSGKITLTEKTDANGVATGNDAAKGYLKNGLDLTTKEGIAATLGYKAGDAAAVAPDKGSALTLQIGDTADSYNQLKVNIKDMHADRLGKDYQKDADGNYVKDADGELVLDESTDSLDDIRIDNQADAAKAVDVIKRAINQVSDLRGTLGATQNRLDHTINNLSVMTENIQDAESTIRDVDVAEEMMAYTKNNILIQSAQAMLAQANQVPQGVLQLLQ
jgi:flagellin